MKNTLYIILYNVFPFIHNANANKKIHSDMEKVGELKPQIDTEILQNKKEECIKHLEQQYRDSLYTKERLEDKAKAIIVAITISITLILGAPSFLNSISTGFQSPAILKVVFSLFLFAAIYMVIAALVSTNMLINKNIVYKIEPMDFILNDSDLCDDYNTQIFLNQKKNLTRNNDIYTSFACIRNSLLCLLVVLIITLVFSFNDNKGTTQPTMQYEQNEYKIAYHSEVVKHIQNHNNQELIEEIMINSISSGIFQDGNTIGIVDENSNLFIKANFKNNTIIISIIELIDVLLHR